MVGLPPLQLNILSVQVENHWYSFPHTRVASHRREMKDLYYVVNIKAYDTIACKHCLIPVTLAITLGIAIILRHMFTILVVVVAKLHIVRPRNEVPPPFLRRCLFLSAELPILLCKQII
jgi:hypothetical protein